MLFKLSYTVSRLDIHSSEPIQFDFGGPDEIRAFIRAPSDDERDKGFQSFNAFLDILGEIEPTKKTIPVFAALFEGRRPPEGVKVSSAEEMIHHDGPSYGLKCYPEPFGSFIDMVGRKLSSVGCSLVSILRWRYAQEGGPSPISTRGLSVSNNNGVSWYPAPSRHSIVSITPPHSVLAHQKIDIGEICNLVEENQQEPVSQELLREAKGLQHSSPRSSVLIAVSALEVAVKTVIVNKVPDAAWLVDSMQSPPVVNILLHYFPVLFSVDKSFYEATKENSLIKVITDAVYIRNQMLHKGASPPTHEKVVEIIAAVQELLWICDYYSGHTWAERHIKALHPSAG